MNRHREDKLGCFLLEAPDSALKQTVLPLCSQFLSLHITSSEGPTPETAISVVEVLPAAVKFKTVFLLPFSIFLVQTYMQSHTRIN